ncbi:MAG: hypothetical protein E2O93_02800, partial [Alphaproteobacteria bacterium]
MRSRIDRGLIVAALLAALPALGGCISSTTYGTGQAPELAVFSEMTGGLAGGNKNKEPINYQPRAPLVMPPDGQLRQPMETASVEGGPWPAGPNEEDIGDRGTGPDDENARDDITPEYVRRLRPIAGLVPAARDDRDDFDNDRDNPKLDTIKKFGQGKQFSADLAEAKGLTRTERRYLTDPPEGYRTPAE